MTALRLVHGICHYFGQWPPGDERGFRAIEHKIHSSGDYKHRPPPTEHEGLRHWLDSHGSGTVVTLNPSEYAILGSAFILKLHKIGANVRCLCCGATHIHALYESVAMDAKVEIAAAKQYASLKLETHPGKVFAKDCSVDAVNDIKHARNLWRYILDHEKLEGAWVWRYDRDAVPTREQIAQLLASCKLKLRKP